MHVAIKILENLAWSPSVQRLLRENSIPLLQDIASATSPRSVWFPPHPSPEDQVEMRRVMTQVLLADHCLLVQCAEDAFAPRLAFNLVADQPKRAVLRSCLFGGI